MRTVLRKLVAKYMTEAINCGDHTTDNIDHMASEFVAEVERILSARRDFKEE